MLGEFPDAETLAAVFARAAAVLEAEGVLPAIPAVEQIVAVEQIPVAATSSASSIRWIASKRIVLLIGGAFTVTACGFLAIKTRLKGLFKLRNLFSHPPRRWPALVPYVLLARASHRPRRLP